MVIQFQGILGHGSRASQTMGRPASAGVNLRGHSFTTRFLMGVQQKGVYKDNPSAFEIFLDTLMEDFGKLYYQGLELDGVRIRFAVLGMKGDLPFLAKAGNLQRTFLHIRKAPKGANSKPLTGCCWLCAAGTDEIPFKELTRHPQWLKTAGRSNNPPWNRIPPFFQHIPHVQVDKPSFLKLDLLHIYHLGIGRDYAGSSLTLALGLYETSIPEALDAMNAELKTFLQQTRKQVHFKVLTRDLLGYTSEKVYPTGHWSKAMDTPVLMDFIRWLLLQHHEALEASRKFKIVSAGCEALSVLMHMMLAAGLWMDPQAALRCGQAGLRFLECYGKLMELRFRDSLCRFNAHCFHHLCINLIESGSSHTASLNPLSQCTFQDEDFIGRVSRLSRRVSPRLQCLRTIQRYLTATRQELDRSAS